jgi:hypothetical protein
MLLTIDVPKIDLLVVDVIELDVFGARLSENSELIKLIFDSKLIYCILNDFKSNTNKTYFS